MKRRLLILGVVLAGLLILFLSFSKNSDTSEVAIILSPHYDDAVLSLGGFITQSKHPVIVATFFTGSPSVATSTEWDKNSGFDSSLDASSARTEEDKKALKVLGATGINYFYTDAQYRKAGENNVDLEQEITQDIQALLASYSNKTISVYAPAIFLPDINHPDHALLHKAFLDVVANYPKKNISFYIYEDYPYVERFNNASLGSLESNLEKESGLLFETEKYILSNSDLSKKEKSLKQYASQIKAFDFVSEDILKQNSQFTIHRCGNPEKPCEVAYKIFKIAD